jgi:thioredoxin 1
MTKLTILALTIFVIAACQPGPQQTQVTPDQPSEVRTESSRDQVGDAQEATAPEADPKYQPYSSESLASAQTRGQTVLFFKADWCPTCRAADDDIRSKLDQIPDDLTILEADFDTESELKRKHGVVGQHTFVLLDQNGEEVTKWIGGGLNEILNQI